MPSVQILADVTITAVTTLTSNISDSGVTEAATNNQATLQTTRLILAMVTVVLIVVAIGGNAIVICAILRTPYLKRLNNYLIVSLSLADLGTATFCMPFFVMELVHDYHWPLPQIICALYAGIEISFGLLSVFNLAAISCERVFLITMPMVYQRVVTETRLISFIIVLWLVSFTYGLLQIFWFYTNEYLTWSQRNPSLCRYLPSKGFAIFAFMLAFVLPLGIMSGAYLKIFCVVQGQMKRIKPRLPSKLEEPASNEATTGKTGCNTRNTATPSYQASEEHPLKDHILSHEDDDRSKNSNINYEVIQGRISQGHREEEPIALGHDALKVLVMDQQSDNKDGKNNTEASASNVSSAHGDMDNWTPQSIPVIRTGGDDVEVGEEGQETQEEHREGAAGIIGMDEKDVHLIPDSFPVNHKYVANNTFIPSSEKGKEEEELITDNPDSTPLPESNKQHTLSETETDQINLAKSQGHHLQNSIIIPSETNKCTSDDDTEIIKSANTLEQNQEQLLVAISVKSRSSHNSEDVQQTTFDRATSDGHSPTFSVGHMSSMNSNKQLLNSDVIDIESPQQTSESEQGVKPQNVEEMNGSIIPGEFGEMRKQRIEIQSDVEEELKYKSQTHLNGVILNNYELNINEKQLESENNILIQYSSECEILENNINIPELVIISEPDKSVLHKEVNNEELHNSLMSKSTSALSNELVRQASSIRRHCSMEEGLNTSTGILYDNISSLSRQSTSIYPLSSCQTDASNNSLNLIETNVKPPSKKNSIVRRVNELPILDKLQSVKQYPMKLHSVLKKKSCKLEECGASALTQKRNSVQFRLYEDEAMEPSSRGEQPVRMVLIDDEITGSSEDNTAETSLSGTNTQRNSSLKGDGESSMYKIPSQRHTLQWAKRHFSVDESSVMENNSSARPGRIGSATNSDGGFSRATSRMRRGLVENKAVKMTSYVIGAFVICWVPYQICLMLRLFKQELVPDILWNVTTVVMFTSTAINPFIYNFYSSQFRAATKRLFLKCSTNAVLPER